MAYNSYLGEIKMWGGNFAPQGYASCDGQLLSVTQNPLLFALVGTTYGGDGRSTFGLPDLRGRLSVHEGQAPGLSPYYMGQEGGTEYVTITAATMPAHSHTVYGSTVAAGSKNPAGKVPAVANTVAYSAGTLDLAMAAVAIGDSVGGGQAHTNMMPYGVIYFILSTSGIYPSRP